MKVIMQTMNHYRDGYLQQVHLMARLLISVSRENVFALKGGTAINLFFRDLPRLSIDIDLTYLQLESRAESLQAIEAALLRIEADVKHRNRGIFVHQKIGRNKQLQKLIVGQNERIKIEPNEVLRGSLYPPELRSLSSEAQSVLGIDIGKIQTLSFEDLYAGKICAALDRQHPRDLFDIDLLYRHEGITDELRKAFVIYVASGPRPMHELLKPNLLDQHSVYQNEFLGMTQENISYDELADIRARLIKDINQSLTDDERQFLLSVKKGEPNYTLMPFESLEKLPALQWKVMNVRKMDANKRELMLSKLKVVLDV